MKSLALTLGHNSSAVLVEGGRVLCGYENERLTGIKSDSQFPIHAIDEINKYYPLDDLKNVYTSHWFIDGKLGDNKWWRPSLLVDRIGTSIELHNLSRDFTHHDAHAYSAMAFAKDMPNENTALIVADGFGTFGETLSIYQMDDLGHPRLVHRTFGFDTSLGLLYQYATSFLGLKENQDEYKLLGYDAHQDEIRIDKLRIVGECVIKDTRAFARKIMRRDINAKYDPVVSIRALPRLKDMYHKKFSRILDGVGIQNHTSREARIVIAAYVQQIVTNTMAGVVKTLSPTNLILVGGLFYNVKLNNDLSNTVKGRTCIMPLAGDQGAALGMCHAFEPDGVKIDNVFWGHRNLQNSKAVIPESFEFMSEPDAINTISDLLKEDIIVNVVRGSMEFGPRALCNTSTLALPTLENTDYINKVNGRSTIMPMAPVIQSSMADVVFDSVDHIHRSLDFMICTRPFKVMSDKFKGVRHSIPTGGFSGRPQIVNHHSNRFMNNILTSTNAQMLINTSFNVHGKPIVFDVDCAIDHHIFQKSKDTEDRIRTIIVVE